MISASESSTPTPSCHFQSFSGSAHRSIPGYFIEALVKLGLALLLGNRPEQGIGLAGAAGMIAG
jgi:hypothetical protein